MDFSEMPWLVTITTDVGTATYGPCEMARAVKAQETLKGRGERAVAWAAQAPDERLVKDPGFLDV